MEIQLSKQLIREFQRDIERVSTRKRNATYDDARRDIIRLLYLGDNAWEIRLLRHLSEHDIHVIDTYIIDCLRAVLTGKTHIGGIGYNPSLPDGCIQRGKGKNVRGNREKTPASLPNYLPIRRMLVIRHNDIAYSCTMIQKLLDINVSIFKISDSCK